MRFPRELWVVQ